MNRHDTALSLSLAVALCAAPVVAQLADPEPVDSVMIDAGSRLYPPGAAERGVQGTVTIRADLSADGVFSNPTIHESSRSEVLDAGAIALVPRLKYTPTDAAGAIPRAVLVPIDFRKDSLASLKTKNCADFNTDAAYFKETFPEQSLGDMPVFDLVVGMLVFAVEPERRLALAQNLPAFKEQVVATCNQSPDSPFLETALGVGK